MPAVDHLAELFEPVGGVTIKRMFGGLGVFKGGLMFALLSSGDVFYFKADEKTVPAFAAEGCEQWVPEMRGRVMAMPYWRAPERLFDEPDDFADWARTAFAVALRTQKKPKGAKSARKAAAKKPARKVAAKKPAARKK